MYKTTDIYPAKTTALRSIFLGGQFKPVSGGQFEMAERGQFLLAEGGQFAWIFHISFPDMNGDKISLSDKKFKDKVVILAIGGTWCPNCVDEASFLAPWYKANKSRGIEVLSIFYERKTDPDFVKKVFTRFKKKYDIQYDIVIGGLADKQQVASSLPALNNFIAFPTTIFIDKKGQVAKIHTGYSGPATGKYFTDFVKEFNDEIDLLLK